MAPWPNESAMTLQLDYWPDELSPAQKAAYEKAEKEHNEVRNKLKEIVAETGGKNIFSGEVFTAYQVLGPVPGLEQISQPITSLSQKKPPSVPPPLVLTSTPRYASAPSGSAEPSTSGRRRGRRADDLEPVGPVLDLVDDDDDEDDYIPLSKRRQKEKEKTTSSPVGARKSTTPEVKTKLPAAAIGSPTVRPSEVSAIGGLQVGVAKDKKRAAPEPSAVVDLTSDEAGKSMPDSREINFSKIQAKTFPSLVVIARPSLRVPDKVPNDRSLLDAKVKNVLVYQATKFTEWLIQQGLIKSDQLCKVHPHQTLKLGMYSDVNKFPYSGGYFWISDCCPQRFTSVFSGSIFEGSPHPPSVMLKLIYHWACQTNVSNVTNWVKVDNLFLKGLYTHLRSVCTLALCRHLELLGGQGKSVEIGVISLGTTTQDGQERQVKVEVLGVFDQTNKLLRLRAIEPLTDGDKSYKKRFAKILEPLGDWVHKDSIILTDLTVDKGTLNTMGFHTVQQVSPAESNVSNSNATIMDYLRRIVPRMFQNTLSLLSRQLIQQFLNELVWREMYGTSPLTTFDNIVRHLSEQAKVDRMENFITRLNKVSADPFKHWVIASDVNKAPAKRGRKPREFAGYVTQSPSSVAPVAATSEASPESVSHPDPPKKSILKKVNREAQQSTPPKPPTVPVATPTTKRGRKKKEVGTVTLETYYYGSTGGGELKESAHPCADFEVWCPECPELTFCSNVELLNHLQRHAIAPPAEDDGSLIQCRCCLKYVADKEELTNHRTIFHPLETKNPLASRPSFNCIICEKGLTSVSVLEAHMQKSHFPLDMPYRCAGCDFCSSSLLTTVDHFYQQHKNSALLQCPFCLKMACAFRAATANSTAEPLMNNVRMFLRHLRHHADSQAFAKPCIKCALIFTSKGAYKLHSIFNHLPCKVSEDKVHPLATSVTEIPMPKKKAVLQRAFSTYRLIKPFNNLVLNMENGSTCLECGNDFDEFNHMVGIVQCLKCPYSTACLPTVVNHAVQCKPRASASAEYPVAKLSQEMHCYCGFSSFDGHALARHLVVCSKAAGVYPSDEAAQANVVKRSMLDMLGLIRREEDEQNGAPQSDVEVKDAEGTAAAAAAAAATATHTQSDETEQMKARRLQEADTEPMSQDDYFAEQNSAAQSDVEVEGAEGTAAAAAAATATHTQSDETEQMKARRLQEADTEPMSQDDYFAEQHEEHLADSGPEPDEGSTSGVTGEGYDPSQSLYNIASAGGEQQFNTQLSFDDLGPPSVLPAQDTDRTPQLKDDYQSLATPRVPEQPDY